MKKTITSLGLLGALLSTSPAMAHHGETTGIFANLAHWLSSPVHSLTSVALLVGLVFAGVTFARKKSNT